VVYFAFSTLVKKLESFAIPVVFAFFNCSTPWEDFAAFLFLSPSLAVAPFPFAVFVDDLRGASSSRYSLRCFSSFDRLKKVQQVIWSQNEPTYS
jgi:hypothetical protein